jgi:hypothetical protein
MFQAALFEEIISNWFYTKQRELLEGVHHVTLALRHLE